MKRTFIVSVDINQEEFDNLNAKRARLVQQPHTIDGFCENKIVEALSVDKLLSGATVRVVKETKLRTTGDVDATL